MLQYSQQNRYILSNQDLISTRQICTLHFIPMLRFLIPKRILQKMCSNYHEILKDAHWIKKLLNHSYLNGAKYRALICIIAEQSLSASIGMILCNAIVSQGGFLIKHKPHNSKKVCIIQAIRLNFILIFIILHCTYEFKIFMQLSSHNYY